jgi:hypothetical protein
VLVAVWREWLEEAAADAAPLAMAEDAAPLPPVSADVGQPPSGHGAVDRDDLP